MENSPLDTLARTCWGEARGEGYEGLQAIANVVVNRASQPSWWGHDIISVCLAPEQFSCWNCGDPNLNKLQVVTAADPIFADCLNIAQAAVNRQLVDITNGATSYYATSMHTPPSWVAKMIQCAEIGHHIFFK